MKLRAPQNVSPPFPSAQMDWKTTFVKWNCGDKLFLLGDSSQKVSWARVDCLMGAMVMTVVIPPQGIQFNGWRTFLPKFFIAAGMTYPHWHRPSAPTSPSLKSKSAHANQLESWLCTLFINASSCHSFNNFVVGRMIVMKGELRVHICLAFLEKYQKILLVPHSCRVLINR